MRKALYYITLTILMPSETAILLLAQGGKVRMSRGDVALDPPGRFPPVLVGCPTDYDTWDETTVVLVGSLNPACISNEDRSCNGGQNSR